MCHEYIKKLDKFVNSNIIDPNLTPTGYYKFKPHQISLLNRIHTQGNSFIVNKARQIGYGFTTQWYCIWNMIDENKSDFHSLIIKPNMDMARNTKRMMGKYCDGTRNASGNPPWIEITESKDRAFECSNSTNSITVIHSSKFLTSQYQDFDMIFVDEFAYMKDQDKILQGLTNYGNISKTKVCIGSTPNMKDDLFTKIFMRALRGQSYSIPIQLDWYAIEEYDEDWKKRMNKMLGLEHASLEYDGLVKLNEHLL